MYRIHLNTAASQRLVQPSNRGPTPPVILTGQLDARNCCFRSQGANRVISVGTQRVMAETDLVADCRYVRLWTVVVLLLCVLLVGCGVYFVGFVSNPGGNSTITGTVSVITVQFLQIVSSNTIITSVTFVSQGNSVTMNFCGDQHSLFNVSQLVTANFISGLNCSTLTTVIAVR